jgi:MoxR-like ATPase
MVEKQKLLAAAVALAEKINQVTNEVLVRNIGRQELIKVIWLGLISKHPVFALGPTGVNKTATIRQIVQRIDGARFAERLVPTIRSAEKLFVAKTRIRETNTADGKEISLSDVLGLDADVHAWFGDEFFKDPDNPAMTELIDFVLEGKVRHEGALVDTPLMLFVTAGNETPDPQSNVRATWSRMTYRVCVNSLDRRQKKDLVQSRLERYQEQVTGVQIASTTLLTLDDVNALQKARPFVAIPENIIDTVLGVYDELGNRSDADFSNILGDDRRFGRIFDAMQAHALMNGRDSVSEVDLALLRYLLWDSESHIPILGEVLAPYTRSPLTEAEELINTLFAPNGAFELARGGNDSKNVEGLSQGRAAIAQLQDFAQEAQDAGDATMKAAIEVLVQQTQVEVQNFMNKILGI